MDVPSVRGRTQFAPTSLQKPVILREAKNLNQNNVNDTIGSAGKFENIFIL